MPAHVTLVTYNLCKGGNRDFGVWRRLFDRLQPDIFLAQESSPPTKYEHSLTQPLQQPAGSTILWLPAGRNHWGSAVFVRSGTVTPITLPDDLAGWVVGAAVRDFPGPTGADRLLHIYSVHTPRGPVGNYAQMVEQILDSIAARSAGADLIIGGDFNIAISRRQPDETRKNSPAELRIFTRLEKFGLINCWQTVHPAQPLARTLRFLHNPASPPYHCDGLFVPATWGPALRTCEVLEYDDPFGAPPSDHNAVVADFDSVAPAP